MCTIRFSTLLVLVFVGCSESPQAVQQKQDLEKKANSLQTQILLVKEQTENLEVSIKEMISGTTVASLSSSYELVYKDTNSQVRNLSKRVEEMNEKLSAIQTSISRHRQKYNSSN
jgi:chaperonin cofactor prefoldin